MCESLIPETKENKLSIDRKVEYARYQGNIYLGPYLLVEKLGLHDNLGGVLTTSTRLLNTRYSSLSEVNDYTSLTPQQIGAYLESVIEGGDDTPWKNLSEYEE